MRPRHSQGVLRGGVQQGPSTLDEKEVSVYFAKRRYAWNVLLFKQRERQPPRRPNYQRRRPRAQPRHHGHHHEHRRKYKNPDESSDEEAMVQRSQQHSKQPRHHGHHHEHQHGHRRKYKNHDESSDEEAMFQRSQQHSKQHSHQRYPPYGRKDDRDSDETGLIPGDVCSMLRCGGEGERTATYVHQCGGVTCVHA